MQLIPPSAVLSGGIRLRDLWIGPTRRNPPPRTLRRGALGAGQVGGDERGAVTTPATRSREREREGSAIGHDRSWPATFRGSRLMYDRTKVSVAGEAAMCAGYHSGSHHDLLRRCAMVLAEDVIGVRERRWAATFRARLGGHHRVLVRRGPLSCTNDTDRHYWPRQRRESLSLLRALRASSRFAKRRGRLLSPG